MCDQATKTEGRKEWLEKAAFIQQQIRETVQQTAEGVPVRLGTITCRCGWKRGIMHMFQCLYCREWFCERCAEDHFGKTREQWRAENPIDI